MGTLLNLRERIMHHQLAKEVDGFSQIVRAISEIVEVSTIRLGGFMAWVQSNVGSG